MIDYGIAFCCCCVVIEEAGGEYYHDYVNSEQYIMISYKLTLVCRRII